MFSVAFIFLCSDANLLLWIWFWVCTKNKYLKENLNGTNTSANSATMWLKNVRSIVMINWIRYKYSLKMVVKVLHKANWSEAKSRTTWPIDMLKMFNILIEWNIPFVDFFTIAMFDKKCVGKLLARNFYNIQYQHHLLHFLHFGNWFCN